MSLWDRIRGWASTDAVKYVYGRIPRERAEMRGADDPLVPYSSYFRVWVADMHLTESVRWGTEWHPAVQASAKLRFASREAVTFASVARPPEGALGKGVFKSFPVTELLPYGGGITEIQGALLALKGSDYTAAALDVLSGFSGLVGPPLAQAITIAEKVASGVEQLFGLSDGHVHLSWHDAFTAPPGPDDTAPNPLRPGYYAVVLADTKKLDARRLVVKGGRLHLRPEGGGTSAPFTEHDYALFEIEGRKERDDWRLPSIQEPLEKAREALVEGRADDAAIHERVALGVAATSLDLAVHDRTRVVKAIKAELAELKRAAHPAMGDSTADLGTIMRRHAMRVDQAIALGELSAAEIFGEG